MRGCGSGRDQNLYQPGHRACGAEGLWKGLLSLCLAVWVECGVERAVLLTAFPSFQKPCQPRTLSLCLGCKLGDPTSGFI